MLTPLIRCYHLENAQLFTFFILCKGDDAGKPGLMPWTNCFAVQCNNRESFDFYFWLAYGLFKTGKFQTRHRGSVIPFVNLQDIRNVLKEAAPAIFNHWLQYRQIMKAMDLLEKTKTTLGQQLLTTEKLQHYLIHRFF